MFSARTKNPRIRLTLESDTEAQIIGIAAELRQVFANLLSNSIDAKDNYASPRWSCAQGRSRWEADNLHSLSNRSRSWSY